MHLCELQRDRQDNVRRKTAAHKDSQVNEEREIQVRHGAGVSGFGARGAALTFNSALTSPLFFFFPIRAFALELSTRSS
jgi:hypothetical protein